LFVNPMLFYKMVEEKSETQELLISKPNIQLKGN